MRTGSESGNVIEAAVSRYWELLRKWRGIDDPGEMTIEDLIMALNDLHRFRGRVAFLAQALLDDVVHDRRAPILVANAN